ncbi:glucan 4-alpha-glucosidase [Colletotrichum truncatum]|uniref:Glucan 4-alpha-glucosidase n=1 Tax=Colletotrichum truncatum TaxID=5467 RepID=A0ACC3ZBE4_COLTU|nr:glucan 4-alpha-glucosidase [Colletotrichum truncatum]KAF6783113.1 glucan 4-alpha-glucosidase [Colletotrichum truncatum]
MSTQTGTASRRPKLSLTIKTSPAPHTTINRSLALVDPKSPTTFNTLSNVYATAIERSTPVITEPLTAINTFQPPTGLKDIVAPQHRIQTPYAVSYPATPLTAHPLSPSVAMEITFPSTMTATPPLSAGPVEGPQMFGFSPIDVQTPLTALVIDQPAPRSLRKRSDLTLTSLKLPYSHPRSLHSILRNSPLPPPSARTPISPRRQSLRLQEKAARRVAYNSPIEQTIITNKYTKSHIDLLIEDASPSSPATAQEQQDTILDLALAFEGNETRDGGMTPGPFEEMRRRMAGLAANSPVVASPTVASPSGGIRKRKRKEKKRRWVWTIGNQEEDPEHVGGAVAALRAAEAAEKKTADDREQKAMPPAVEVQPCSDLPTPSVETFEEAADVEMSDTCSVSCGQGPAAGDTDMDLTTPTVCRRPTPRNDRLGSADLFNPETGSRRDTPIPPDLVVSC